MRPLTPALAGAALVLAAIAVAPGCSDPRAGSRAPNVTFIGMDDVRFDLASLRGRTVLLNFWFYNCVGCVAEMPHLSDLWSEISTQRDDVTFLSVNHGDSKQLIGDYWSEGGFLHPAVRQEGSDVSRAFGVIAYPVNFVIGPDGDILYGSAGWDEPAIREALAATAR